jgi:uncharacterized protein (DUF2249 family)
MATTSIEIPAALSAGVRSLRILDVRPVIAKGGEPFTEIMEALRSLSADEALVLVVGFEPVPLYAVLESLGFARHVEREGAEWRVFIRRSAEGEVRPAPASPAGSPAAAPVELDVRGLEPPRPLIRILDALARLGPGAELLVRHHREPTLLYEALRLRGYAARAEKLAEGDWLVRIAPDPAPGAAGR